MEQQPHLSLPEKASQVSYLVEIYGTQLTKGSVFSFVIHSQTIISR